MPELPEVESVVRMLTPSLPGRRVAAVNVYWPGSIAGMEPAQFQQELRHARFTTVLRHGKYLFLGLEREHQGVPVKLHLAVHLRMTGRLLLMSRTETPGPHTRISIDLEDGSTLRLDDPRKFARVRLMDDPAAVTAGLGPDALTVGADEFMRRCSRYSRQLKPLLLDQSFLAGIGNIYADESLFRARLHPLASSSSLSREELTRLYQAVISVLREAVESNGANIDGVFKAGRFQVQVYGRKGAACRVCGHPIVKISVGQRGTHLCTSCQPDPR